MLWDDVATMIMSGRGLAQKYLECVKERVAELKRPPVLAVILVGSNPSSQAYVRKKQQACEDIGIVSRLISLPEEVSQEELRRIVIELGREEEVDGILVQLPLPKHIDQEEIIIAIPPEKDVDGLTPFNLGLLMSGSKKGFIPCTPKGILRLLESYDIPLRGKRVVIMGRSLIVGKPLAMLLLQKEQSCSVTVLHSESEEIAEELLLADIVITAIGKPHFLRANMVKRRAVIVDVGITSVLQSDGTRVLQGDADSWGMRDHVGAYTPVPRGVGPMTIAMLMENTYEAALARGR